MASFSAIALVERSKFGLNELLGASSPRPIRACLATEDRHGSREHACTYYQQQLHLGSGSSEQWQARRCGQSCYSR